MVYDQYLRAALKPTLDFKDPIFTIKLAEALAYVDSALSYFERNEVKAVCVSHTVYNLAIPARIAIARQIPAFQVNGESIYRLSNQNSHAFTEFKKYREKFRELENSVKAFGLNEAENRLSRRMSGEVGVDMLYSSVSAYSDTNKSNKILTKTNLFFQAF